MVSTRMNTFLPVNFIATSIVNKKQKYGFRILVLVFSVLFSMSNLQCFEFHNLIVFHYAYSFCSFKGASTGFSFASLSARVLI